MALIEVKDAGKRYERGGRPFWALRHASLSVDAGEFVTLLGRSGSGKSTLLSARSGSTSSPMRRLRRFATNARGTCRRGRACSRT